MNKHIPRCSRCVVLASVVAAITMALCTMPAQALDVAGVSFAQKASANATTLQLNGAGVGYIANHPVYAASLYLEKKESSPSVAMSAPGAKQLRIVLLRDVNSREMGSLLTEGLLKNSTEEQNAAIIPEIAALGNFISDRGLLSAGDSLQIDWSPAFGTAITIRERALSKPLVRVFSKPDLILAMMRIWLGSHPADVDLKGALLGHPG